MSRSVETSPDPEDEPSIAQDAAEFPYLLITGWLLTAAYAAGAFACGGIAAGVVDLIGVLVGWPFTFWAYRRGRRNLGNYVLLLGVNALLVNGQLLISDRGGFAFFYLPVGASPLMLFRPGERRHIFVGIAIVVVGAILGELSQGHLLGYRPVGFPVTLAHFVNLTAAFGIGLAILQLYAVANRRLRIARVDQELRARRDLQDAFDKLALSERQLSAIFDVMVDPIMIQDVAGNVVRVNEAAVEKFGLGRPRNIYEVYDWTMYDVNGRALAIEELPSRVALRTARAQLGVHLEVVHGDGTRHDIKVNSIPFRTDGGEGPPSHVVTTILDVTAQAKSERLLYQIVNSTPDWIFIKDRQHRYLNANTSFAAAIGLTPDQVIGKNDLELGFPREDVLGDDARGTRGWWRDDEAVFESNRLHTFSDDRWTVEGSVRTFHTIKTPLHEGDPNEAYALLGYSRDITHLKEIEERLVQSSKMASLGQMAGGVAHEINNPLAIIQGRAQVLLMDIDAGKADPARTRDTVTKIVETARRIARIVRGLQSFSRHGENDPFAVVGVPKIVDDAVALCVDRMKKSDVTLHVTTPPRLDVMAKATQLGQVLLNLLQNAHDAVAGRPGAWVRVDFAHDDECLKIMVIDAGPPIPDAVVAKLMQPFFTTKPAGQGTGLGLMLSQKIVDRHRGKLYLDRAAAHTCFVMEIPIHRPAPAG